MRDIVWFEDTYRVYQHRHVILLASIALGMATLNVEHSLGGDAVIVVQTWVLGAGSSFLNMMGHRFDGVVEAPFAGRGLALAMD